MIEVIFGYGKSLESIINIVVLATSATFLLLFVYATRIILFRNMTKKVQNVRKLYPEEQTSMGRYDPSISKRGLHYQKYLLSYLIMQMIVQIIILFSIGVNIAYKNNAFSDRIVHSDQTEIHSDQIEISYDIWVMIGIGYFLPNMGILTVFLTTFFWAQEFFLGLALDLVSIMEIDFNKAANNEESVNNTKGINTVNIFLKPDLLRESYNKLRKTSCMKKFKISLQDTKYCNYMHAMCMSGGWH